MANSSQIRSAIWVLVLILVGFLIYLPGLQIQRYGDDIQLILDSPPSNPLYFFFNQHPSNWYRPLEFNFEAITQKLFGLTTIPIHIASIFSHIFLVYLVYSLTLCLGFKKNQAVLAAMFMGLSQVTAHPVFSNDTLSQVWSTLLGFLSIWFLCHRPTKTLTVPEPHKLSKFYNLLTNSRYISSYLLSLLAFALSLFSKEVGLAFLPIIFIFLFFYATRQHTNLSDVASTKASEQTEGNYVSFHAMLSAKYFKETFIKIIPYVVIAVLYFIVRSLIANMPPSFGSGRYQFHLGLNIIKNIFSLIFASLVPVSSVTVFVAIANSEFLKIGVIAGATILLTALVAWGIFRTEKRFPTYLLACSSLLAFFPMAALNHVSELHVYSALPFIAIIVGVGLGKLLEIKRRILILTLIALLFTSHVYALETKLTLMKKNGERATSLVSQLRSYALGVPPGAKLFFLNPQLKKTDALKTPTSTLNPYVPVEYSVFLINGFNILESADTIEQILGRHDIEIKIIESPDWANIKAGYHIISLDDYGQLYKINP